MKLKILLVFIFTIIIVFTISCESSLEPKGPKRYLPELVLINENLTFTMGCLDLPGWTCVHRDVIPSFKAILNPYYIGKYEVRNDEYHYFVKDGGYTDSTVWSDSGWVFMQKENRIKPVYWIDAEEPWINCSLSNTPDRPISNISWYEAEAYCNWLSKKTGEDFSLPTEAQWERAARGPDPGRIFSYGNAHDKSKYNNMMYSRELYPVGHYKGDQSLDGCYDMAGNLLEFCSDLYEVEIYQKYKENEPVFNPTGPDSNITGNRSIRGIFNFFHNDPNMEYQIQTFTRMNWNPEAILETNGFRVKKNELKR